MYGLGRAERSSGARRFIGTSVIGVMRQGAGSLSHPVATTVSLVPGPILYRKTECP